MFPLLKEIQSDRFQPAQASQSAVPVSGSYVDTDVAFDSLVEQRWRASRGSSSGAGTFRASTHARWLRIHPVTVPDFGCSRSFVSVPFSAYDLARHDSPFPLPPTRNASALKSPSSARMTIPSSVPPFRHLCHVVCSSSSTSSTAAFHQHRRPISSTSPPLPSPVRLPFELAMPSSLASSLKGEAVVIAHGLLCAQHLFQCPS